MMPAGEGKLEEGAGCFGQAVAATGQEIDLATPTTHPCPDPCETDPDPLGVDRLFEGCP